MIYASVKGFSIPVDLGDPSTQPLAGNSYENLIGLMIVLS
jgi:hypothetical protein